MREGEREIRRKEGRKKANFRYLLVLFPKCLQLSGLVQNKVIVLNSIRYPMQVAGTQELAYPLLYLNEDIS